MNETMKLTYITLVDCLVAKQINERDHTDYRVVAYDSDSVDSRVYIIMLGEMVVFISHMKYTPVLEYFAPIWNKE